MKYKGAYDASTSYSVGDVVVYTDGIPYFLQNPASAGTGCHDTHCWNPLNEEARDMVIMFHDFLNGLAETKAIADTVIFDEKTLILSSSTESSDKKWAITVDDTDGVEATEVTEGD